MLTVTYEKFRDKIGTHSLPAKFLIFLHKKKNKKEEGMYETKIPIQLPFT